jgi:7-carboxy-7-deazaguanine synthase
MHITIETAGTIDRPVACDLMSISPKLANSTPSLERAGAWRQRHEATRDQPQVIRRLVRDYDAQIKFVVDRPEDFREIGEWLARFPEIPPERVWMMPQGIEPAGLAERETWIRPYCESHGYRFCPRMHIAWFGNTRGT